MTTGLAEWMNLNMAASSAGEGEGFSSKAEHKLGVKIQSLVYPLKAFDSGELLPIRVEIADLDGPMA